jgi:beta-hydroxylase
MGDRGKARGRIAACAIVLLLLAILVLACGEAVRRQGELRVAPWKFYTGLCFPLAPFNLWCSLRTTGGDRPFPGMETHFPRHGRLRANWKAIRDEAVAAHARGLTTRIKGDLFFRTIADDGWKKLYIKWHAEPDAVARAACPRTCALLEGLPEVRVAMFSILEPGSRISPHVGPSKSAKRYHLGLSCPPEARILVDGIPYSWRDGEDVLFDDTYVHEVVNASATRPRVVLFCDVETRLAGPVSRWVNRKACDLFGPLTTRANDRTEATSKGSASPPAPPPDEKGEPPVGPAGGEAPERARAQATGASAGGARA